jgi:hypothetical protein
MLNFANGHVIRYARRTTTTPTNDDQPSTLPHGDLSSESILWCSIRHVPVQKYQSDGKLDGSGEYGRELPDTLGYGIGVTTDAFVIRTVQYSRLRVRETYDIKLVMRPMPATAFLLSPLPSSNDTFPLTSFAFSAFQCKAQNNCPRVRS